MINLYFGNCNLKIYQKEENEIIINQLARGIVLHRRVLRDVPYDKYIIDRSRCIIIREKRHTRSWNDKIFSDVLFDVNKEIRDDYSLEYKAWLRSEKCTQVFGKWPNPSKPEEEGYRVEANIINWFDDVWNKSLSFYLDSIEETVKAEILSLFNEIELYLLQDHETLVNKLKTIGEAFKLHGPKWSKNWRFFVDLSMCYRYYSNPNILEQVKSISAWFNPKPLKITSSDEWKDSFERSLNKFYLENWSMPSEIKWPSFREYVYSGDWGTSGSTDVSVSKSLTRDIEIAKNKNASFVGLDLNDLFMSVHDVTGQKNKCTLKPDEAPNKSRLIVSGDMKNYLLQSYLSQWLTRGYNYNISTAYMDNHEATRFWLRFLDKTVSNGIKIPIDQSAFDHHIDRNSLESFFYKISEVCSKIENEVHFYSCVLYISIFSDESVWQFTIDTDALSDELSKYCSENKIQIEHSQGRVKLKGRWNGGLPSGWRWTIDTDTIMNYCQFDTISNYVGISANWNIFQGDDLAPIFNTVSEAISIVAGYKYCGLEVNAKKFFISATRHEFLRRVVSSEGIVGYPARAVHSLLWRPNTAVSREEVSPWSMADLWLIACRRGFSLIRNMDKMIKDISGAFKIEGFKIREWLSTPAALGGYGGQGIFGWPKNFVSILAKPKVAKGLFTTGTSAKVGRSYRLTEFQTTNALRSLLDMRKQVKRSEIWEAKEIEDIPRTICPYKFSVVGVCRYNTLPNFVKRETANNVLNGDYTYLHGDSLSTYLRIKARNSKNNLLLWLNGDKISTFPKSLQFGNDYISGYYSKQLEEVTRAFSARKSNRRIVQSCALWMEMHLMYSKELVNALGRAGLSKSAILGA